MSLVRILRLAEILYDSDEKEFNKLCTYASAYLKKHAHFKPENDGTTPNPWRRNMDYSAEENSPYYGSVSEFMEKFPGGIKDWVKWRKKTQKKRNKLYSKISARRDAVRDKIAHFSNQSPSSVEKLKDEKPFYSGEGFSNYDSAREFIESYSQSADDGDDAAKKAMNDVINYWKLMRKSKKRRKK